MDEIWDSGWNHLRWHSFESSLMSGEIGLGVIVVDVDLFLSSSQPMMEVLLPCAPEFLLFSRENLPDLVLSLNVFTFGISQPA